MNKWTIARYLLPIGLLAACAQVQVDGSRPAAVTSAPFAATLGFNRVDVPENSRLTAATLDGKSAYCTPFPAYSAPGERRAVCFTDPDGTGYLTSYYVLGTLRNQIFDAHIPYTLVGTASRTVASSAPPPASASQLTDGEWAQVDEIRAKQIAGVKLMLPEARLLIKAEHSAQDQAQRRQAAEQQEAARAQQMAAARQARAECTARAQTATLTTPGLLPGLLAGIAAGNVCENYHRNTGTLND
jgi:hypothetical protein